MSLEVVGALVALGSADEACETVVVSVLVGQIESGNVRVLVLDELLERREVVELRSFCGTATGFTALVVELRAEQLVVCGSLRGSRRDGDVVAVDVDDDPTAIRVLVAGDLVLDVRRGLLVGEVGALIGDVGMARSPILVDEGMVEIALGGIASDVGW